MRIWSGWANRREQRVRRSPCVPPVAARRRDRPDRAVSVRGRERVKRPASDDALSTHQPHCGNSGGGAALGRLRHHPRAVKLPQQCARLAVPRDWRRPPPARRPVAAPGAGDGRHGAIGSLLINPGGPGESAVKEFSDLVDTVSKHLRKKFDVVAFDPRGVGQSTPVHCVNDATIERLTSENPVPTGPPASSAVIQGDRTLAAACARTSGAAAVRRHARRRPGHGRHPFGRRRPETQLPGLFVRHGTGAMYADLFPHAFARSFSTDRSTRRRTRSPAPKSRRTAFNQRWRRFSATAAIIARPVRTRAVPPGRT